MKEVINKVNQHDELLDVIARTVADHTIQLDRIEDVVTNHTVRLERIDDVVADHTVRLGRIEKIVADHSVRLGRIEDKITAIEKDVAIIKTDIRELSLKFDKILALFTKRDSEFAGSWA